MEARYMFETLIDQPLSNVVLKRIDDRGRLMLGRHERTEN